MEHLPSFMYANCGVEGEGECHCLLALPFICDVCGSCDLVNQQLRTFLLLDYLNQNDL